MVLSLVVCVLTVAFLSNDMYMPALPQIVETFKVDARLAEQTMTAWFLGSMSPQLLVGPISDSVGRKYVFLFALFGIMVTCFLAAVTDSFVFFVLLRYLQGFFSACIMVVAYVISHESASSNLVAAKNVSYVSIFSSLATMFGPLLGGYVCSCCDWRFTFYLLSMSSFCCLFGVVWKLPETNKRVRKLNMPLILKRYASFLSDDKYLAVVCGYSFLMMSGGVLLGGIPFVVTKVFDKQIIDSGYTMVPLLVAYVVGAWITGRLSEKVSQRQIIRFSLLLVAGVYVVFVLTSSFVSLSYKQTLCFLAAYYFSFGICGPHMNSIALERAKNDNLKGAASALFSVISMLFCSLGIFIFSCFECTIKNFAISMFVPIICACFIFEYILLRRGLAKKEVMTNKIIGDRVL